MVKKEIYILDFDNENDLEAGDSEDARLGVTINNAGTQELKFYISKGESKDRSEYKTYNWTGTVEQVKQINDGVINTEYMSSDSKGQWFKVRFNEDGLANFCTNSSSLDNDIYM
ncbi:MAG: hypothetical protein N4A48_09620 [Tepidibacter sp.]|jgi:hypothetical protein|uniref:hypothetical protein n=1 Tax=Tepidibacter sp. TaxID=2529387 RepID=UPI0025E5C249|nr:hypothetical protein [Tepidibacter sp.]MCT4509003.1 hypothetical protein [Tepidibacter sp.]